MIVLSDVEDHMVVCLFGSTKHRNVTDRQTDGRTARDYDSGLHCEQCGRVVKMTPYSDCKVKYSRTN